MDEVMCGKYAGAAPAGNTVPIRTEARGRKLGTDSQTNAPGHWLGARIGPSAPRSSLLDLFGSPCTTSGCPDGPPRMRPARPGFAVPVPCFFLFVFAACQKPLPPAWLWHPWRALSRCFPACAGARRISPRRLGLCRHRRHPPRTRPNLRLSAFPTSMCRPGS